MLRQINYYLGVRKLGRPLENQLLFPGGRGWGWGVIGQSSKRQSRDELYNFKKKRAEASERWAVEGRRETGSVPTLMFFHKTGAAGLKLGFFLPRNLIALLTVDGVGRRDDCREFQIRRGWRKETQFHLVRRSGGSAKGPERAQRARPLIGPGTRVPGGRSGIGGLFVIPSFFH